MRRVESLLHTQPNATKADLLRVQFSFRKRASTGQR